MKAFIKRSVMFLLALVISFISVVSFCDVPEAHATAVDLYSTEQIIATLMYSLGISVQAYDTWTDGTGALQPDFTSDRYQVIEGGGGSGQEDPEPKPKKYYFVPSKKDADACLQQLYAAEAARKPDIDAMIETAKKTGKIVIDKASGLWEYLKENVGKVVTSLKKSELNNENEILDDYNLASLNVYPYTEFYQYLGLVVKGMYARVGVDTSDELSFGDVNCEYFISSSEPAYYILFTTFLSRADGSDYEVHGVPCRSREEFLSRLSDIKGGHVSEDSRVAYPYSVWDFFKSLNGAYHDYNRYLSGRLCDIHILNMAEFHLLQQSYTPAIAAKSNYDRVYVPEPGHATEIITPDTQVEQNPDGSYSVTGDYVIDMKNPVSYPVDMTDGVTLDDKKTPVAEILPKQDPSIKPKPEPDPEPEPKPDPEPLSLWEQLFRWLKMIYDAAVQLPQILTSNGLVLGNIVSSMSTISLAVHAIQTAAEGLLSGFDGLEIPDYSDLIQELPALFADAIEFPEINIPEIPNYMDILKQMLDLLKNLLTLGNIQSLLQSMFVIDYDAVAAALRDALNVWDFDFLTDLKNLFNFNYTDNYDYPRIAVKCPKILAPYYGKAEIVLCDFSNYKTQLKWGRNIIRMMIWVYFLYAVFNHFRVKLDLS